MLGNSAISESPISSQAVAGLVTIYSDNHIPLEVFIFLDNTRAKTLNWIISERSTNWNIVDEGVLWDLSNVCSDWIADNNKQDWTV